MKERFDEEFEMRVKKEIEHRKQMKEWAKQNMKKHKAVDCFYHLTLEQLEQCRDFAEEKNDGSVVYWNAYLKQVRPLFREGE